MSVDVERAEELAPSERMAWNSRPVWNRRRLVAEREATRDGLGRTGHHQRRRSHRAPDLDRTALVATPPLLVRVDGSPASARNEAQVSAKGGTR